MQKRYDQLDSIRGLAAITVVILHCLSIFYPTRIYEWLIYSPLAIVSAGHEAVILFFVLSGFVLSLPFLNKKINYPSFMMKRICRIYIPYIVAITSALILWSLCSRNGIKGLSDWFNLMWTGAIDAKLIIYHIFMTGGKQYKLDVVMWSLVSEMRIYFIFPFILLLVIRKKIALNVIVGLLLSIVGFVLSHYLNRFAIIESLAQTIHYISFFILGAILAKHREILIGYLSKSKKITKFVLALAAWLLYTYHYWFLHDVSSFHVWVLDDWMSALGASLIFIIALSSVTATKFLLLKPIHFMGKISYSFYLFHVIILLTVFNLYYGKLPLVVLLVISIVVSLIVATLSYYYIELPSISIGRALSQKYKLRSYRNSPDLVRVNQ